MGLMWQLHLMRVLVILITMVLLLACSRGEPAMPLHFSGYLGGSDIDDCDDVVSRNGGIYYACHSNSEDFAGSRRTDESNELDGYVVRMDAHTGVITYVTRIGGSAYDNALRLRID